MIYRMKRRGPRMEPLKYQGTWRKSASNGDLLVPTCQVAREPAEETRKEVECGERLEEREVGNRI